MTDDRSFDRLTRAWLDLMPDEAPDRTIESVLQAVETTPQVRRPWRWLPWRPTPMNRAILAIGTTAVIIAAGALYFGRSSSSSDVGPSATPSASASSSPAALVPPELQSRWMGEHRPIVDEEAGSSIVFDTDTFFHTQSNQHEDEFLTSSAAADGDNQFRLESTSGDNCQLGDVGVYRWSVSASGRVLTITEESDDCASRLATVPGVWWKMGCKNPDDPCLGDLDAGTYKSQFIRPRTDAGATWFPDVGAVTYTVPDGWANTSDWPSTFGLTPSSEYAAVTATSAEVGTEIFLFTQPVAVAQEPPCGNQPQAGVGHTVEDLVAWLRQLPGLVTSEPAAITVGGHPGQSIDLSLDPNRVAECDVLEYLKAPDADSVAVGPGERERLILVDLGDGDVLAIRLFARDATAFDSFAVEAMSIVESFQFE